MTIKKRKRVQIHFEEGSSLTKQSFKDQVNINTIVAKHRRTGMFEHLNEKTPFYGDVSHIEDYKSCLEIVIKAKTLFAGMSADIRERFKNDPNEMISFLNDKSNLKEAEELQMITKPIQSPPEPPTPPGSLPPTPPPTTPEPTT